MKQQQIRFYLNYELLLLINITNIAKSLLFSNPVLCRSPKLNSASTQLRGVFMTTVYLHTGVALRDICLFSVCLFVCQHDNFRTIKRRMMKIGG